MQKIFLVCVLFLSACGSWSVSVSGSVTSGAGAFETKQEVVDTEVKQSNISESNLF